MKKTFLFLIALTAVVGSTAYISCGNFDFRMFLGISTFWIGGPLLLLTLAVGCLRLKKRGWLAWRPAGWILAAVIAALITDELSRRVLYWEQERAQRYPALVDGELEQFRQAHGRYPSTLDELHPTTSPPRLTVYWVDAGEYSFSMRNEGLVWGSWHYDRTTRTWTYND